MISMIACIGQNNELGKKGDLCFRFKEDLAFFKKTTMGKYCIIGKNTYDSLSESKLPGRKLLVLSRDEEWTKKHKDDSDTRTFANDKLLKIWIDKNIPNEEIFVIGGASIYKQFLPLADKLYITYVNKIDSEADVFFPEIERKLWNIENNPNKYECSEYILLFYTYIKDKLNFKRDQLNKQMIQYVENNNKNNIRFWQMMVNLANERGFKLILENHATGEQNDPFFWETLDGSDIKKQI